MRRSTTNPTSRARDNSDALCKVEKHQAFDPSDEQRQVERARVGVDEGSL
jgi:hypothetical protein